jgi:hypothetical protein
MNHCFGYLMVAGLALAGSHAAPLASSVPDPVPNVEVLVDGVVQRRYAHAGRWYIEARKGREYAIRLRNPYGVRVAVALSVDGLNTIDGRETTSATARKWVLGPHETVTISGWQTSRTHARRFEFTTEDRSYGQALGKTANLGVISAAFFKERVNVVAAERQAASPAGPAGKRGDSAARVGEAKQADNEYAATGMGRETGHAVTQVWLDLEDRPAHNVNIRYEFRPQLVALGILPQAERLDPLQRRERAQGFEEGFAPVPPGHR